MAREGRAQRHQAQCLVCDGGATDVLYVLSRHSVLRCRHCAQVFLWPLLTPDEIRQQFESGYGTGEGETPELRDYYQYGYRDDPDNPLLQTYERWLNALEAHHGPGRLLDVGCGTGLFLAAARRRGWQGVGIEENREAIRFAVERLGCEIYPGDFDRLSGVQLPVGSFDAITMLDVLEHSRAPVALLQAVRARLAPGGIVGVAVPNQRNVLDVVAAALYRASGGRIVQPLERQYVSQHFSYFTPATLSATLARAGLQLVELRSEETDLRRLSLSVPTRIVLRALFVLGRLTKRQNRLFAVAQPAAGPGSSS